MAAKETDDVRPITIRIKGRDVHFNKHCGGVLDCDFEELCARPLWTNDYLKMTQVFHTVLIRNIPILSQKNRSEARRFICLIDTLRSQTEGGGLGGGALLGAFPERGDLPSTKTG